MNCVFVLSLFFYLPCSASQFAAVQRQHESQCDLSNRDTLVEHFFNTIFSEFHASPPSCACVQVCAGQSTYCYPNGCLKINESVKATSGQQQATKFETQPHQAQNNRNQFTLTKNTKSDFMTDYLARNYADDSKMAQRMIPVDMRPDPFKDRYSMVRKHKRVPRIEISYNLHDKVKNAKHTSENGKIENTDLLLAKGPINNRHKIFTEAERPLLGRGNYFAAILPENEVAEYPPKYFKRDTAKNSDKDDVNYKAFYILEDALNATGDGNFSFEKLIDALIRSSFGANLETTQINSEIPVTIKTEIGNVNVDNSTTEKINLVNPIVLVNDSTSVISINSTNENVDKNKYTDISFKSNKTANISDMIGYLAKEIDKQNNTSMEMAKIVVDGFNALKIHEENITLKGNESNYKLAEINSTFAHNEASDTTETISNATTKVSTDTTTIVNVQVTKKNRQRIARKLPNRHKIN